MPHRQSGGELARLRSLSSDEGFRGLDCLASECFEVLDDRGEGWGHPASLRDVVESHNADVVGDPHAMSEECVTHANGDVIVASENRVGEMSGDKFFSHGCPGFGSPGIGWHPCRVDADLFADGDVGGKPF